MPDHRSSPPDDLSQFDAELHLTARPDPRFYRALWEYASEIERLDEEAVEADQVADPTGDDPLAALVELQRRRDEQLIADYQRGRAS